ncbi:hypothetical protein [Arthrobacter sp. B2a2-09]|uniref:hypothetical protein n=1 Tax=Arthrobacter sp. B2a2-09 TaxID=2952822 RepID=UPI0022CD5A2E|nr:hypothetical protein [Arthrobacter sp. B2a2-09]MCZ9884598.1 hypothetical protein [Arthrobacter sp. B2a2-09]
MTKPQSQPEVETNPPLRAVGWHRPLLWLSIAMAALAIVSVVGLFVDSRILTGAPIWAKPLKFAISICVYTLTLSWLIGLLKRGQRFAWWAGTVAAVFLLVEIVVIVGAVIAGTTSHFNVSTPFHAAIWGVMAVSIVIVWAAALPVVVMLFRQDLGDIARSLAIRAGFVVALIGMALAFLMTSPTPQQLSDFQGIAGAHTVGIPDGGPGLPILGWSTVAGDLRIPHFIGMHALQIIPLVEIALEILARKSRVLRRPTTRRGIIWVVIALYVGVLAVVTGQALSGESIVRPSPLVTLFTIVLFVGAALAIAALVVRTRNSDSRATAERHKAL